MPSLSLHRPLAGLLALAFATSLFAHGQFWDFLGSTQVSEHQDHGRIQILRSDRFFRTILLRVSEEAIFFDRFVVYFENGSSQVIVVGGRIAKGENFVINLSGEGAVLKSVELWYYKEPWGKNPTVTLYGDRFLTPNVESTPSDLRLDRQTVFE